MNQKTEVAVDMVIVGASTRAAAFSAIRAGFTPLCLDQFADADLQAIAATSRVADYPSGLIPALGQLPPMPLVYCGGIENCEDVLQAAADRHQLWGNDASAVAQTRDPETLTDACRLARIEFPEWRPSSDPPPQDGTWLLKPRNGTGGRGITIWNESAGQSATLQEPHYFQKKVTGTSFSACFIAPPEIGDIRFIGVTEQLVGAAECHARPFQWCGNIGPAFLPIPIEHRIRRLGNVLKWKLGLKGLFGIDLIVDEAENAWALEVNPRYPASLELLEHATGIPFLREHCACFEDAALPPLRKELPATTGIIGKAILYADDTLHIDREQADLRSVSVWDLPTLADVPQVGNCLKSGDPVCTVFAQGQTMAATRDLLHAELRRLEAALRGDHKGNGAV